MKISELQHLAAAMAHDVRNPLNSMAIHIELLEGRLKRKDETVSDRAGALKSLGVLAAEIERVDGILDEYLQYAGPPEVARRPVEARALLGEAARRARAQAEERGVGVELKLPAQLGQWTIDAEGVAAVLDAVLANAIEASARGGAVQLEVRADEEQAEVVVLDRGEGIAPEDLGRVFQLGFSRRGRSGIGLAVAKQIVKGHGGSITAQSSGPSGGAALTIRLPIEKDS